MCLTETAVIPPGMVRMASVRVEVRVWSGKERVLVREANTQAGAQRVRDAVSLLDFQRTGLFINNV